MSTRIGGGQGRELAVGSNVFDLRAFAERAVGTAQASRNRDDEHRSEEDSGEPGLEWAPLRGHARDCSLEWANEITFSEEGVSEGASAPGSELFIKDRKKFSSISLASIGGFLVKLTA